MNRHVKSLLAWLLTGFIIEFLLVFMSSVHFLFLPLPYAVLDVFGIGAALNAGFIFLILGLISEFYLRKPRSAFFKLDLPKSVVAGVLLAMSILGFIFYAVPLSFPHAIISPLGVLTSIWPWQTATYQATPESDVIPENHYLGLLVLAFWLYVAACLIVGLYRRLRENVHGTSSARVR